MLFLDGKRDTSIKLLGVDHDRDLVEMLTGWLQTLGYEVYRASSGKQAMCEWGEHQPDLVILDTMLKDVDALALCREMRSVHDALVIVVIAACACRQYECRLHVRVPRFPRLGLEPRWRKQVDQGPNAPPQSESGTGRRKPALPPHRSGSGLHVGISARG
jgi:CheY-like chemotaxis protein